MAYREPEFLPWGGRRVPLTFVAGYLGAGKTTAINEVLATTEDPIAVIVNDVGEVNIDASLVRRRSRDTIELTDGCVCCSSIEGFGAAFDQLRARPEPPHHVVVELSGVAEPANVVPWGNSAGFLLDGVVTVVAADQLLEDDPPDGSAGDGQYSEAQLGDGRVPAWVRPHLEAQIAAADLLVVTKTDLVGEAAVAGARARLATIAPSTPIVDGGFGRRQPGALGRFLALGGHHGRRVGDVPGPTLFDLHSTAIVRVPEPLDSDRLDALLDRVPEIVGVPPASVVRIKGIVLGPDGDRLLVQVVGRRRQVTRLLPDEPGAAGDLVVITVG